MKNRIILTALFVLFGWMTASAQNVQTFLINDSTNGTTIIAPGAAEAAIFDDGGAEGFYSPGHDYKLTVESNCSDYDSTGMKYMYISLEKVDIVCTDTLYIYDGPTINDPVLIKINNCYRSNPNKSIYLGASNTTGKLTIRLRSSNGTPESKGDGIHLMVKCGIPCEYSEPVIDSVFDRVDLRTGEIVGHGKMRLVPEYIDTTFYKEVVQVRTDSVISITGTDTTWYYKLDTIQTDSIIRIDTNSWVNAALLCIGHGVIFHGHGEYNHDFGYYNPTDETTLFKWKMGADTLSQIGATSARCDNFQSTSCSDVYLYITDSNGCASSMFSHIQVRVAQNPIKTIFDLANICNNDSLLVNVGYEGDNGTLTLKKIEYVQHVTKVNEIRVFIPDGPYCDDPCYEAPVEFTEFGSGKIVSSAADICSICINYEHTYMGDYRVAIRCPNYNENSGQGQAILKYGKYDNTQYHTCSSCDPLAPADSPDGVYAGSGDNTGWPTHDDVSGIDPATGKDKACDSLWNPFGVGLDYCWSRNYQYTLVTGDAADVPTHFQPGDWYISVQSNKEPMGSILPPTPNYFLNHPGQPPSPSGNDTRTHSDYENKEFYYSPASDFSELIGCPLNGTWKAVICDFWAGDNGWVFNWSMDICGASQGGDCVYQVGLDSVVWHPDTNYATDFRDGRYRGLQIRQKWNDTTAAYISSPDTCGDFRVKLRIYDEFGCIWDTITKISTVCTPEPDLGPDTVLCNVNTMQLDATDRYTNMPGVNYSFMWEPFGQEVGIITTTPGTNTAYNYIVEVTNEQKGKRCIARDTINVAVNDQPIPSFDPGLYPLEGCEPLTININNTTKYGYKYRWVFGDGTYSTQKDPTHTYAAGQYDFKYYVESEKGCKDSLIYSKLISVYPNPNASFSWEPVYPSVTHPSIQLENRTTPDDGSNKYFWEIQYDKNRNYSFQTLTEANPSYEWVSKTGEDVSGNYTVRLISRSDNTAPSGHVVQCADTVENTILIINDFLQFPSVVTPNGDGINDRFVIINLVEGKGYPINTLDIYDKWGSRVYHAENISTDDQFWDPATTNAPTGTYFYRFMGKGYSGNIERNGVIELLK